MLTLHRVINSVVHRIEERRRQRREAQFRPLAMNAGSFAEQVQWSLSSPDENSGWISTCGCCGQSRSASAMPAILREVRGCPATAAVFVGPRQVLQESLLMPSRLSLFARAGAFEKRTELRIPGLASCIGAGGSLLRKHYHVLVDALPRLYWLQQLPAAEIAALTLCVSHQLGRYEDLLRALLPVGVQLRYVDDDCWIAADRYLLLPQLSMSSCGALPVGYTAQLQAFGARFAGMTGQPARRRLFISRQQASMRRISNFDQLAPLLQAHGVEVVALETLSVAAQAALFHAAELVISAHGAGLSNLLFASSARVIELAAAEPRPHYRCLCTAMGHDYRSVVVHDGGKNDDFELPSARLAALLKELDEEPAKPIRTQASSA